MFEKLNTLSINIFQINYYQDGNNWEHNLITFAISKNESDKVSELMLYKNHYAPLKN